MLFHGVLFEVVCLLQFDIGLVCCFRGMSYVPSNLKEPVSSCDFKHS